MKGDPRYTTESIWDTYPWPQNPSQKQVEQVANAAKALRDERNRIMRENQMTLSDIYRIVDKPGHNTIKILHDELDAAVIEAYGFSKRKDVLEQLLQLNLIVATKEAGKEFTQKPGIPPTLAHKKYVTDDSVKFIL